MVRTTFNGILEMFYVFDEVWYMCIDKPDNVKRLKILDLPTLCETSCNTS